jgi:acetyl-CoA C-acetyltransferase
MREVVIAAAVRTAIGKLGGALSTVPAFELGEVVVREALDRAKIRPDKVDEVIMGNVFQGELGQNPAGEVAVRAGISRYIPALTVNKVYGAGMKAVIMAAQVIRAGDADIVVAGGMENMSQAPPLVPVVEPCKDGDSGKVIESVIKDGLWSSFGHADTDVSPESVGEKFNIGREEQDDYAAESHRKAEVAITSGRFKDEIVPVKVLAATGESLVMDTDENPLFGNTVERLAALEPNLRRDGTITAGNSSGIADGASALLIMSAEKAFKMGIRPLAKIVAYDYQWCEPELMGYGPIYAVRRAMEKARDLLARDIDLVELNETFAAQSIASLRELNLDPQTVNVNGGAIALGHPLGSSGARILTTLLYEMEKRGSKVGLAAGMGIATIVQREWYF